MTAWIASVSDGALIAAANSYMGRLIVVVDDDVDRLWAAAYRVFPPYARYRRQAAESGRTIPLVRLSPAPSRREALSRRGSSSAAL